MRESKIEKDVCDFAKSKGWLCYKFSSPNNRGVPDRIFIRNGQTVFIEFKAPGKKASKLQKRIMDRISSEKIDCYVVDNIAEGKALFCII